MVGRALVAERGGDRRVDREMARRRRRRARSCASVSGHSWLRCAMVRRLATVRWQRPSARVGRGGDGRRIGRPHRRGRESGGARAGPAPPRRRCRAPRASRGSGRGCGRSMPCARPSRRLCAHLLDALQRRRAREGDVALVGGGGEVAEAEAGIIVARPDDAVEIDLDQRHQLSARPRGRCRPARGRAARRSPASSVAVPSAPRRDMAVAGGEIGEPRRRRASSARRPARRRCRPGSARAPRGSVRIWSVGADMVGPPSKMST